MTPLKGQMKDPFFHRGHSRTSEKSDIHIAIHNRSKTTVVKKEQE